MTIDRAVMAFAGLVVLVSLALAQWQSPVWLLLTAFVGVNLLQASVGAEASPLKGGLCSYTRGDLASMRTHAATFLHDVAARPDWPRPASRIGSKARPTTSPGEFVEALRELERAVA